MLNTSIALLLAFAGLSGSAEPEPHFVSITVDDHKEKATIGSEINYGINVRNDDPEQLELVVRANLPKGMTYLRDDNDGSAQGQEVTWQATVESGAVTTLHTVGRLDSVAPKARGIAMTVCAYKSGEEDTPIVCTTDLDPLTSPRS